MNIGLIGYGAFGGFHAQAIARTPGAVLTAVCCNSEASATKARGDYPGVTVLRDYRELLARPDIEAVNVVVPNYLHGEIGVAALKAGKHVLMEKPLATTVDDCDRLVEAARASGKQLSTGFELRLSNQWGAIKRLIDAGEIGEPVYANVSLLRYPYRGGSGGWRITSDQVGSWILEEPVHHFDFLMWYLESLGDPLAVRAYGTPATGEPGKYDNFTSVMRYSGGKHAVISMTLSAFEHHLLCELVGTKGAVRTWWSGAGARDEKPQFELKIHRHGQQGTEIVSLEASGELVELEEEIRRTYAAFAEGRALVPPKESRKRVVMCLAAEQSVREDREVPVKF